MAIKKSELYASLWESCDVLRGSMDASQYKDYVLLLLFIKFVSDRAKAPDSVFEVPENGSFEYLVTLKNKSDIGEKMNKAVAALAEANELQGSIGNADFDDSSLLGSGQAKVDKLSDLIAVFEKPELDFSSNRAQQDDLLGDAYEYLMRNFATQSGKSKGQFYTPAEVSRVIAQVIGIDSNTKQNETVYDPTCGSGSLLIRASDQAPRGLTIYGQENDSATQKMAVMNMFVHNQPYAEIKLGNTIATPLFTNGGRLKQFDYAVANPPFSQKNWMQGLANPVADPYGRFYLGVPPKKNGDYAFFLHLLASLKSTGKGAIIMPHGVLFRGNAEATIREAIVKRGHIKGIIGLPANLFYGTGIPACIIVLDKEHADERDAIFMIDASQGFMKDGPKNRLRERDIHRIVNTFHLQADVPGYARLVPHAEIEANGYNLNLPRYIDTTPPEDLQDIAAHLQGGIPARDVDALEDYWQQFGTLRQTLFASNGREGYYTLQVAPASVRRTILSHFDLQAFTLSVENRYAEWRSTVRPSMWALTEDAVPKAFIAVIAEALLEAMQDHPLVDPYALYQNLMDYWQSTMQDDLYLISGLGWEAGARLRMLPPKTKKKEGESGSTSKAPTPDLVVDKIGYAADLIPPQYIIDRYFKAEETAANAFLTEAVEVDAQVQELFEEHGGDEELLGAVVSDRDKDGGKIVKSDVEKRIREIALDDDFADELAMLKQYLSLVNKAAALKKKYREAWEKLRRTVRNKYATLTIEEIKTLVVDDKWLATLHRLNAEEVERVTHGLAERVQVLGERYNAPLLHIVASVEELTGRVDDHLRRMGYAWN